MALAMLHSPSHRVSPASSEIALTELVEAMGLKVMMVSLTVVR